MTNQARSAAGAAQSGSGPGPMPWWMKTFNPISKGLLAAGIPLGFNGLITVRGRKTGRDRTTPVAIIESEGRRWVWAPYGEVQWVRNLRASGHATITSRRRTEEVAATELDHEGRIAFFRDVIGPIARGMPGGLWFIRTMDRTDLRDPASAAVGRPVFELRARA